MKKNPAQFKLILNRRIGNYLSNQIYTNDHEIENVPQIFERWR